MKIKLIFLHMKYNYGKLLFPTLLLFVTISLIFMVAATFWENIGVDHWVVLISNLLLYIISAITVWMHLQAINNPNPNVFTRSVMGGTVLKLFVLGVAVMIYLVIAGSKKNVYSIFIGMFLYMIYTAFDVKAALQLNKNQKN